MNFLALNIENFKAIETKLVISLVKKFIIFMASKCHSSVESWIGMKIVRMLKIKKLKKKKREKGGGHKNNEIF